MVNYSEDFKRECKEVYPKWLGLHEALDSGSEFVGEYLSEASKDYLDIDQVLSIDDITSLNQLKEKAREIKKKRDLFDKWLKLRIDVARSSISKEIG